MADVTITIAAQDMASSVLEGITRQTRVMTASVQSMASGVVTSTRAMSVGFTGLMTSLLPLAALMFSMKAVFAVFNFGRDSIMAFVEAGSPAGKELGATMQLASDAITKLMATVGAMLAPFVKVVSQGIIVFVNAITEMLTPAVSGIGGMFEGLQPYFDMFLRGIIAAVTAAEVGFTNLGSVFKFATNTMLLGLVGMVENTKHTFTVALPAYIMWFGENAYNILRDAAVGMATVITNLGKNLGEFGAAIYTWISGGMQGGVEGLMSQMGETMMVGLLDGFEAQTQALPQIAARALTQTEINLAAEAGAAGANLGQQFSEKYAARVAAMSGQLAIPEMQDAAQAEETTKKLTGGLTKVAESQSEIAQQLSATESRLLTRGPSQGPMESVAQASQKTAEAAEGTRQSSDRMVELLEQLVSKQFIIAEAV